MKPGDRVVRNPKYKWCECGRYAKCWCKKGTFVVTETKPQRASQSGLMVKVSKDGQTLDSFVDSSYFIKEQAPDLPGMTFTGMETA